MEKILNRTNTFYNVKGYKVLLRKINHGRKDMG